jgi:RHS repeat-associated protein
MQALTDNIVSSNSQSFAYDALSRLTQATGSYGGYQWSYDADGNRLTQVHGTEKTGYSYGSGNDLLKGMSLNGTATQRFGYTAEGQLDSLNPGVSSPVDTRITELSYNQGGQYAEAKSFGRTLASYTYDGFGQRAAKTISSTLYARYVYGLNGMLLEETNAVGAAQADYIYVAGMPVAVIDHSGTVSYLHTDHLGTPQFATGSDQSLIWKAAYQPFGVASTSGTITQNLRLPGQYFDLETGWNHNGFRDYLPELGRYIEPDPLGRLGSGNNLFAYAGDNPINVVDPLGLSSLVYNGSTSTITLYSGNNFDGTILAQGVAYNHPASGWSYFPYGTYQADSWHQYNAGDSDSGYGPYGNLTFKVPGHQGLSVHSGRINHVSGPYHWTGPSYYTEGCIRTNDAFMKKMYDTQFHNFNPVKQIMNINPFNPPPGTNPTPLFWPAGAGNPPAPSNPWNF